MKVLRMLDQCNSLSSPDWTVLGDETTNPGESTTCAFGSRSLKFDKANGAETTASAGLYRDIGSWDFTELPLGAELAWFLDVTAVTNIAYTWVRLGTDSSNYTEWQFDDSDLIYTSRFNFCHVPLWNWASKTGITDLTNLDYFAVGVKFDAESDTLSDILVDCICVIEGVAAAGGGATAVAVEMGRVVSSDPTYAAGDNVPLTIQTDGDASVTLTDAQGATGAAAPTEMVQQGLLANAAPPTAATAGHSVRRSANLYGATHDASYSWSDNANRSVDTAPAIQSKFGPVTFTQLTAAGSTAAQNVRPRTTIEYAVTVASIDTSVTVRVEGSHDNTNWFNLDDAAIDTTYTANGTYELCKYGVAAEYVRFTFVSEAGGANATLDVSLMAGN